MKRTLLILALLTLAVAMTDQAPSALAEEDLAVCGIVPYGWTCRIAIECSTQLACLVEGQARRVSTTICRCCPTCQFPPCPIQECTERVIGVSCGC